MLTTHNFARPTQPHVPTLSATLSSLIPGSFYVGYQDGVVTVEVDGWTGVSDIDVQAQVDSCATNSARVQAKWEVDNDIFTHSLTLTAFALVVMDEINVVRTNPAAILVARTASQIKTAIKNKIDTLS